jgi:hypothetical protein
MFPIEFKVKCTGHQSRNTFLGSRTLPFPPRVTISHIWTTHGRKIFSIEFKGQVRWTYGFRASECYPFHLETQYHTYGLPIGGRCFLSNLGSKGQSPSALDNEIAIWSPFQVLE